MYKGFNLSFSKNLSEFKSRGEELNSNNRAAIQKTIDAFLIDGGAIDGSRLQERWFPQVDADVFLSHSHQDKDIATSLAGWLSKTFNLKPFIDSCIWGYSDDLLKRINDKYCWNSDKTAYDYEKIKNSASHIHMMLVTALGMMIDSTECLIFLNTPNSITSKDVVSRTQSPWLYMELAMSQIVRRKTSRCHRQIIECAGLAKKLEEVKFEYDVNLMPLTKITESTLAKWKSEYAKQHKHSLDTLYSIV